ncbi:MAG: isocitrate lyase/phosphoenolpyruvate mutase family protein [Actinomycetota bacterium]|nr:isocitrate lyase/phosphoenolpyruvate mutase family protein [Actinomycetota bacterium]
MTRVVAYVPDLMDRSKVAAAGDCIFVPRPADLAPLSAEADVVVVDLTKPGVVDVLAGLDARIIGFANHTSREVMDAARAAGCEQVLPRSDFFARIDELLA